MGTEQEQRITELLRLHWDRARGDEGFPPESRINPESEDLRSIWDHCFLVKVNYTNIEHPYAYLYLGEALVKAYGGEDAVAREVCEALVYPSSMSMIHKFKEVIDGKTAIHEEGEFTNSVGEVIKFRSELLPLGDSQGEIGFILGGMKWKAY